jgi:circadian clock protein KaiA
MGVLLPAVLTIVSHSESDHDRLQSLQKRRQFFYHNASVLMVLSPSVFVEMLRGNLSASDSPPYSLSDQIDRAIGLFLQLSPTCGLPQGEDREAAMGNSMSPDRMHIQQQRLAEKLRERLGYMGVYYHRDPARFFRQLPPEEQQAMSLRLRGLYQAIILEYFHAPPVANARIDEFVALAFFGDISVAQVLELHMNLMDDFAKQLKLEGRNEEILLDYRITLIDVIAHLSEMYRRSIPRSLSPQ